MEKKNKIKQHVQAPFDILNLDPLELVVYLNIKRFQNKDTGEAFPSIPTICEKSGVSKSKVESSIKKLEELDYIQIKKQGRGKVNIYSFNPYKQYEMITVDFLDDDNLNAQGKGILAMCIHIMEKFPEERCGKIWYDNPMMCQKINVSYNTLRKYLKQFEELGYMKEEKLNKTNSNTRLKIVEKTFYPDKFNQSIIFEIRRQAKEIEEIKRTMVSEDKVRDIIQEELRKFYKTSGEYVNYEEIKE